MGQAEAAIGNVSVLKAQVLEQVYLKYYVEDAHAWPTGNSNGLQVGLGRKSNLCSRALAHIGSISLYVQCDYCLD